MQFHSHFSKHIATKNHQAGVVMVEFALVATFGFLTLMFGIIEYSRVLSQINTLNEATRYGARLASVCDANASAIKTKMTTKFSNVLEPNLTSSNIVVTYHKEDGSTSCTAADCATVTVSITGYNIRTFIPYLTTAQKTIAMPNASTTRPRERLDNGSGGTRNDLCG